MAKKKEKDHGKEKPKRIKDETFQSILAIGFFIIALFLLLSAFSKAGIVGDKIYWFFKLLFGVGYFLMPVCLIILGVAFFRDLDRRFPISKMIMGLVLFLSSLALIEIGSGGAGGKAGILLSHPLVSLFDVYSSVAFLFGLIIISLLVIFDTHLNSETFKFWRLFKRDKDVDKEKNKNTDDEENEDVEEEEEVEEEPVKKESILAKVIAPKKKEEKPAEEDSFTPKAMPLLTRGKEYVPPPLDLLEGDRGKPGVGDIKANTNIIKRTLQNFGIDVEMDEVTIGPTVTRYSMKPAEGVKLSRIVGLQDNLALALAAASIRIEAPIPGKSLVGIEVPNSSKTTVGLGSLIASKEFQESGKSLLMSIGKDVAGKAVFSDLAKMPHLLIAGTTGSGKSVTVHALLTSLLYRNSPDILKFIMVDAKRVELTLYNKIPHLLTPVITEAKKTILALKWAAKEMDRRYDVLEKESVRDISSYHKNVLEPALKKDLKDGENLPETMPYIVVVIDELADLMQAYPRELESAIVRLAQMSRAVGIHLVLSTQRPSVNVITGLIKANIPTRIALKVGSQIDSRTILDKAGAEKLVGQGDMLFSTQDKPEPTRIQSPFISEGEVKKVVKYLVDNFRDEIPNQDIALSGNPEESNKNPIFDSNNMMGDDGADEDDLYPEAKEIVMQAGKASTSYLQRKLRIGYSRAARLMDILEEKGIIGSSDGSKPREVIGYEKSAGEEENPENDEGLTHV